MAQPEEIPVLHAADLRAQREIPEVKERLERVQRMMESPVNPLKQIGPNLWVVDRSLARRATMHVVENPEENPDSEAN